mmetsp:Transcript_71707/g.201170  ORF Transcript_71707/g.201170 Transcript_71707/m.201170 type:complete len:211 (+) Transcript_71707:61-693(+)
MVLARARWAAQFWEWSKTAAQAGCIAASADLTCQLARDHQKRGEAAGTWSSRFGRVDWRRVASFGAFSFFYGGFLQRFLYRGFDAAFGAQQTGVVVMKKVAADLAVAPVIYIPCFYMATGLLTGLSIEASAQRLSDQFRETITAYVSLWPGAVFLVFRLVPEHHRILTMAGFAFMEKCIYSWLELRKPAGVAGAAVLPGVQPPLAVPVAS